MKQMITLTSLIMIMTTISLILKTEKSKKEKKSPFECGFDPNHKTRYPFSLRFFLTTVIFLIFDVEVCILLPIPASSMSINMMNFQIYNFLIFIILTAGLLMEWNQGALNWMN